MSSTVYYVIGIVAVVLVLYYAVLGKFMAKRKKRQFAEFEQNHSGEPLTPEKKRLLAFGALLAYYRSEEIFGIVPKKRIDTYIYGIKNSYGIHDHDSAIDMLNRLLDLTSSSELDTAFDHSLPKVVKLQTRIAKELKVPLKEVQQTTSTYGWDICRVISLAKWCYWAGHISETEMWDYMHKGAEKATGIGKSWKEYTVSFLIGRTMQDFDLDDIIVEASQLYHSKAPPLGKATDIDVFQQCSFL